MTKIPNCTGCQVCFNEKHRVLNDLYRAIHGNDKTYSWPDWVYRVREIVQSQSEKTHQSNKTTANAR